MCFYKETAYPCGHTIKTPNPLCDLTPHCTQSYETLTGMNDDLSLVRAIIYKLNMDFDDVCLKDDIKELKGKVNHFFHTHSKCGLHDRDGLMKGLRDTETFFEAEVMKVGGRPTERVVAEDTCPDICWEGLEMKMRKN